MFIYLDLSMSTSRLVYLLDCRRISASVLFPNNLTSQHKQVPHLVISFLSLLEFPGGIFQCRIKRRWEYRIQRYLL